MDNTKGEASLDCAAQAICQQSLRTAMAGRDALLFAAAADVDAGTLRRFCRAVADQLGGQVAELSQLLLGHGCRPVTLDDERMDRLRAHLVEALGPEAPAETAETPGSRPTTAEVRGSTEDQKTGPDTAVERGGASRRRKLPAHAPRDNRPAPPGRARQRADK